MQRHLTAAFAAVLLAGLPVRAQDGPAPAPGQPGRPSAEDEARRLREEAEAELLEGRAGGGTPEEQLRGSAALEVEDESVLYQQLLDAFYSTANRLNAFNPRLTVFGDILGRWSVSSAELVEDGRNVDDRISLREVELDLRADIDPFSKGVLILAFEEVDAGEYEATIEEGYLTLETLPFGFRAQAGRYRLPFGQVNRLHTHDLPQATTPYALVDFFGEEGLVENAATISWLAPFGPLELSATFLNGENERMLAGSGSDDPAWLGRAEYFVQLGQRMFLSAGASYLFGYRDPATPVDQPGAPELETHVTGADLLLKWQWNQFQSIALQGEVFHLRREAGAGDREHGFGGYAYLQVQPLQRWYVGLRYDWSNLAEGVEDKEQWAGGVWLSYYTTEFLRLRVGYEHRERQGGDDDLDTIFVQLTFVFGSHPVEPFWVNR
jgi:hypothetical protein